MMTCTLGEIQIPKTGFYGTGVKTSARHTRYNLAGTGGIFQTSEHRAISETLKYYFDSFFEIFDIFLVKTKQIEWY